MREADEVLKHYRRWDVAGLQLFYSGKKVRDPREAFDISIEKWVVLHDLALHGIKLHDGGPETCGLCMLFFGQDCMGCPVKGTTGLSGCRATPYEGWCKNRSAEAAMAEIKFLEGLYERCFGGGDG